MKNRKYTAAALAIIAAATLSSHAFAAGATGDVVLGLYNSSNSLEFDLGSFSALTSGETWNFGTAIETQLGASNEPFGFDVAASGGTGSGGGGLSSFVDAFTIGANGTVAGIASNTSAVADIKTEVAGYGVTGTSGGTNLTGGTSSTGTAFKAYNIANSKSASFYNQFVTAENYGYGGATGTSGNFAGSFPDTTDTFAFYTQDSSNDLTEIGTFSFSNDGSNNDILTFNALPTPEPSAYALGLCAVALFWVLKRRSSTIA